MANRRFRVKVFSFVLAFCMLLAYMPAVAFGSAVGSTIVITDITSTDASFTVHWNTTVYPGEQHNSITLEFSTVNSFPPSAANSTITNIQATQQQYTVSNLLPNTRYYVRLVLLIGTNRQVNSNIFDVLTAPEPEELTMFSAFSEMYLSPTQAQLTANYFVYSSIVNVTRIGFAYSASNNKPSADSDPTVDVRPNQNTFLPSNGTIVPPAMNNLQPGTVYYYRAFVTYRINNIEFTEYSETQQYAHGGQSASSVVSTYIAYFADGRVYAEGRLSSTQGVIDRGFVFSYTDQNPTWNSNHGVITAMGGNFSFESSFVPQSNTGTVFVRAYANVGNQYQYGHSVTVSINDRYPVAITGDVEYITSMSAEVVIRTASHSANLLLERGVVYSRTNATPTYDGSGCMIAHADDLQHGETVVLLENLNRNTRYYARAFAKSANGTTYGDVRQFETESDDKILTLNVRNITNNSVMAGGLISNTQGYAIQEKGFVYSTNPEPAVTNTIPVVAPDNNMGEYWLEINNLHNETTYYVRAYYRTIQGVTYGQPRRFTTVNPSYVTIESITDIAATTAKVNANVSPEIIYNVTERGVVYSRSNEAPAIGGSNTDHVPDVAAGTGDFTIALANLERNARYHVRAYARTVQGAYTYSTVHDLITTNNIEVVINYVLHDGASIGTQTIVTELDRVLDGNNLSLPAGYYLQQTGFRHTVTGSLTIDLVVLPLSVLPGPETEFIEGVGAYMFEPNRPITRIEVARMVYNLRADATQRYQGQAFTDIPVDYRYANVIHYVSFMNYFSGYPEDGSFKPENNMTRAEVATVLSKVYQYQPNNSVNISFSDISEHWARNIVILLAQNRVIAGYPDGTFKPQETMTRAEATQLFGSAEERTMQPLGTAEFLDVPKSHWAYNRIMNSSIPRP